MPRELLKISEIAQKANVLSSTIRYYTEIGLLNVTDYTQGGQRLFDERETLSRLRQIKWLVEKGYSIKQIKQELNNIAEKKKILIVDDEKEVCEFISELIKDKFPQEVKIANDGFTAARMLDNFLPDIIILDLLLPGIDGFEVCKQIRNDRNLKDIKILAITGYDTAENRQKIMSAGADDYLAKPMDTGILLGKIKALLEI